MSSMREVWASMWQALQGFKCVFLLSAHPASHLSLLLLLLISLLCRLCRCKPLFATHCILHEVALLPSVADTVLMLFTAEYVSFVFFPAVEMAGTVKKMCLM